MTTNSFDKITWGDQVIVDSSAPPEYRPSEEGSVCGIYALDTDDKARRYGGTLGTVMYLIEFTDGNAIEIPNVFLRKVQ